MSKIEWTDITWNPVTGCDKISAGCKNCYAEPMTRRLQGMGQEKYKDGFAVRCHPEELTRDFGKKPKRIFVNSMSDTFHARVPFDFVFEIFNTCGMHPQHTFIFLTKRPERMSEYLREYDIPQNVWLGASIEDELQVWRAKFLNPWRIGSRIKNFISFEPLLGPIPAIDLSGIDWVIVGGESGPGARPINPEWARGIRDQCIAQEVPFFFKQWGEWYPNGWIQHDKFSLQKPLTATTGKNGVWNMRRVGKKAAGRILDGRTWDQFPKGVEQCQ
jgi:protein gp37